MYFIDTNVFLEYFLDRQYAEQCEKIFNAIKAKKISAVCSYFSMQSICICAVGMKKQRQFQRFLDYISGLDNLSVIYTNVSDSKQILKTTEETSLDYDDALQYYIAEKAGCEAIITLDQDFKKTKINSLHPKEFKIQQP